MRPSRSAELDTRGITSSARPGYIAQRAQVQLEGATHVIGGFEHAAPSGSSARGSQRLALRLTQQRTRALGIPLQNRLLGELAQVVRGDPATLGLNLRGQLVENLERIRQSPCCS